jgi:hypothetical protein
MPFVPARTTLLVPQRIDEPELLDLGIGTPQEVQDCLADLWRINRFLGGVAGITRYLYPRLLAAKQPSVVVDTGTGAAQIASAIAAWACVKGLPVRVIGVDLSARNLVHAQRFIQHQPNASLIQADANHLPFAGVDYVISSLFLHHFPPEQVIELLKNTYQSARRGIVMSDLIRGWMPYYAFKLSQPVFARSYLTRHDGALSVRRAYTPDELRQLAQAACIPNPKVYVYFPWRMTLVVDK